MGSWTGEPSRRDHSRQGPCAAAGQTPARGDVALHSHAEPVSAFKGSRHVLPLWLVLEQRLWAACQVFSPTRYVQVATLLWAPRFVDFP